MRNGIRAGSSAILCPGSPVHRFTTALDPTHTHTRTYTPARDTRHGANQRGGQVACTQLRATTSRHRICPRVSRFFSLFHSSAPPLTVHRLLSPRSTIHSASHRAAMHTHGERTSHRASNESDLSPLDSNRRSARRALANFRITRAVSRHVCLVLRRCRRSTDDPPSIVVLVVLVVVVVARRRRIVVSVSPRAYERARHGHGS